MILGAIGFALGWRPALAGPAPWARWSSRWAPRRFAALGLLLGGTLRAEIVLAIANLLWFVFAGFGALTVETTMIPQGGQVGWPGVTPSGALTEALSQAMSLSVDWFGLAVLAAWGAVAALAAMRWFRFT